MDKRYLAVGSIGTLFGGCAAIKSIEKISSEIEKANLEKLTSDISKVTTSLKNIETAIKGVNVFNTPFRRITPERSGEPKTKEITRPPETYDQESSWIDYLPCCAWPMAAALVIGGLLVWNYRRGKRKEGIDLY